MLERYLKMGKTDSIGYCSNCPRNQLGICPSILKILMQENEFQSPKQFTLTAKHYLYHQGEHNHEIYILREGWVLLTKVSEQGKRQIIRSVLPGEMIGFQANISGPAVYSAVALVDSVVCSVPDFMKMCSVHPELTLKLVWTQACENTMTELYMANIAHCDAREKVAFMALELYQRMKFRGLNKGYTIPFPLKQVDIADTLGLTHTHVNRTLHKLEQENLLSLYKHELTILDYEKLNALVGLELHALETCDIDCGH